METRPVHVYTRIDHADIPKVATWHAWSTAADENGSEPVAIIEFDDGTVTSVPVDKIVFIIE